MPQLDQIREKIHTNVWAGGKLLATYDNDGLHFYFDDPLGTRRAQTDSSGVIEQTCSSLSYGDQLSCVSQPDTGGNISPYIASLYAPTEHHFTGKERDSESGNDYFEARYYSSTMGRFMSPDWSAKVEPVPYAKLDDPQTLNLYAYMMNNPLAGVDADGHACELCQMIRNSFNGYGLITDSQRNEREKWNNPSTELYLQPVFSKIESDGDVKILHTVWRLTDNNGRAVPGKYKIAELIDRHVGVSDFDPLTAWDTTASKDKMNMFDDGQGTTGRTGGLSSLTQRFVAIDSHGKRIPLTIRIGNHDYSAITINFHGYGNPATVNDLKGTLPVTKDPTPPRDKGGYGQYKDPE
jgi:RHS repeat-associated protein